MSLHPRRGSRRAQRLVSAVGSAAALLLLAACGGGSLSEGGGEGGDDSGPVKIGLSVPLSGVYAPLGEDMTQGFQLYLDQNDGQLGGREIDLASADEGEGPQTGVPATTKLVTQDQVSAVVGIVNSATALGLQDTFVQSEVPLIIANAGADDITADASPYIWRTSFTNGQVAAALGAEVAEAVNFVKQYSTFGLAGNVQLFGAGFLTEGGALEAQGDSALGVKTSLHYSDTIDTERNKTFVEEYQAAYDELPTVYAVQAYDAAQALAAAIESAETTDGKGIGAALAGIGEIDSPRGPWTFDENHDPDQPYFLREVQKTDAGFSNVVLNELND